MNKICLTLFCIVVLASSTLHAQSQPKFGASKGAGSRVPSTGESQQHKHAKHGPHNGELIEVGNEPIHLEIVADEERGELTIYVLDEKIETPVPLQLDYLVINAKNQGKGVQYKLPAAPLTTDPVKSSSSFKLKNAELLRVLHEHSSDPKIALKVGNKSYSLKIPHDHAHHIGLNQSGKAQKK